MPAGRPASRSRRLKPWQARTAVAARQAPHLPQRILAGIGLCILLAILLAADSPHLTPSSVSGPAHLETTIGDLWNLATRKNTATFSGPGSVVSGLGFSPAGNTLAVAAGDTDMTDLWNLATRKRTATLTDPSTGECGIQGIALSPDGKSLAVADEDGNTYLWNTSWLPT
jgi:WD40 repeat protein